MAINLLQEIGYLEARLSSDLVESAVEALKPYEGRPVDEGLFNKMADELKAALATTIGSWDWICGHQPHTLWLNPTTGERTRPRVEGKRLVDVLANSIVAKLLRFAEQALRKSVVGQLDDAEKVAEEVVQQAVLSLGFWECKYNYQRRGCYWYDSDTGNWDGACYCGVVIGLE